MGGRRDLEGARYGAGTEHVRLGPGQGSRSTAVKKVLAGVIIGIFSCLFAEYLFLTRGGMPVATKGGPLPFERLMAKAALRSAIGTAAEQPSPIAADEANLAAGARVYHENCAVCHGSLGGHASATALGMFPAPPQLLPPSKGVTDDPVGETYWKARNGIRLTGMPGYGDTLSDTELWQVSLLLLHARELPRAAQNALRP
jgi:thiosulfate dehydrogenase